MEDEALAGEPHGLPDPGAVPVRVAVDLAVLACRLGVLGAVGPPCRGVAQEVGAVGAKSGRLHAQVHLEVSTVDPLLLRGLFVLAAAVDLDELGEDPVVLIDCAHSGRLSRLTVSAIWHVLHISVIHNQLPRNGPKCE